MTPEEPHDGSKPGPDKPAPRTRGAALDAELRVRERGADGGTWTWVFAFPGQVRCAVDEPTGRALVGSARATFAISNRTCRLRELVDPKGGRTTSSARRRPVDRR